MTLSIVVLPEPFAPINAVTSPGRADKETSLRANAAEGLAHTFDTSVAEPPATNPSNESVVAGGSAAVATGDGPSSPRRRYWRSRPATRQPSPLRPRRRGCRPE